MRRIEEDEEHADIEESSIESGSVLESLGAEFVMYLFQTNFHSFFSSELK